MNSAKPLWPRLNWDPFLAIGVAGLFVALLCFGVLMMGECIPRHGSAWMHACDAAKQRDVWLYPSILAAELLLATWLQARGSRMSAAIAFTSGIGAFVVALLAENLTIP